MSDMLLRTSLPTSGPLLESASEAGALGPSKQPPFVYTDGVPAHCMNSPRLPPQYVACLIPFITEFPT